MATVVAQKIVYPKRASRYPAVCRGQEAAGPGVVPPTGQAPMKSSSSRSSLGLGRAPTRVLTTSPPTYTFIVGMLVTP